MLPPVAALSDAFLGSFSQSNHTPLDPRVQIGASLHTAPAQATATTAQFAGDRLSIMSLSGQLQLAQGLSVVAETLGTILKVERHDGETLSDYAERLGEVMSGLSPSERISLQKALNQFMKGVTLRMLTEILKNPVGPEATRLALQLETDAYLVREPLAKKVVTSYRQNGGLDLPLPPQPKPAILLETGKYQAPQYDRNLLSASVVLPERIAADAAMSKLSRGGADPSMAYTPDDGEPYALSEGHSLEHSADEVQGQRAVKADSTSAAMRPASSNQPAPANRAMVQGLADTVAFSSLQALEGPLQTDPGSNTLAFTSSRTTEAPESHAARSDTPELDGGHKQDTAAPRSQQTVGLSQDRSPLSLAVASTLLGRSNTAQTQAAATAQTIDEYALASEDQLPVEADHSPATSVNRPTAAAVLRNTMAVAHAVTETRQPAGRVDARTSWQVGTPADAGFTDAATALGRSTPEDMTYDGPALARMSLIADADASVEAHTRPSPAATTSQGNTIVASRKVDAALIETLMEEVGSGENWLAGIYTEESQDTWLAATSSVIAAGEAPEQAASSLPGKPMPALMTSTLQAEPTAAAFPETLASQEETLAGTARTTLPEADTAQETTAHNPASSSRTAEATAAAQATIAAQAALVPKVVVREAIVPVFVPYPPQAGFEEEEQHLIEAVDVVDEDGSRKRGRRQQGSDAQDGDGADTAGEQTASSIADHGQDMTTDVRWHDAGDLQHLATDRNDAEAYYQRMAAW
jgi:hypothetical protein